MKNLFFLSLILISVSSCTSVGLIAGGKSTTFEGDYELSSKGSIEKSKSKLKSVLYADGWNKSREDLNTISFENSSSQGSELGMGKFTISTIEAFFSESGVTLRISQNGNFKFGTEDEVKKTFMKIKEQYELN